MRTLIIMAMLISWAQSAGAGEERKSSWRLRCAANANKSFTFEFNATRRSQIEDMHNAMLRKGSIQPSDFCAVSIR